MSKRTIIIGIAALLLIIAAIYSAIQDGKQLIEPDQEPEPKVKKEPKVEPKAEPVPEPDKRAAQDEAQKVIGKKVNKPGTDEQTK